MAEAFFNLFADDKAMAQSAGTQPSAMVNPTVSLAMSEIGIDISSKLPTLLTQEMLDGAERVITMGCIVEEACPANLVPTEDWSLEDPRQKTLYRVRAIRDEIEVRIRALLQEMGNL